MCWVELHYGTVSLGGGGGGGANFDQFLRNLVIDFDHF